ncbi:MAG: hypothetical protein ACE5LH_08765 [Fidelibacterota bacterium]
MSGRGHTAFVYAFVAVSCLVLSGTAQTPPETGREGYGIVLKVTGDARFLTSLTGEKAALKAGQILSRSATVITGPGSTVLVVVLGDRSLMKIRACTQTTMSMGHSPDPPTATVGRGFTLTAPTSVASVKG